MKWFALILLLALLVVGMAACDQNTGVTAQKDGTDNPPETVNQSGPYSGPILPDPEGAVDEMDILMTPQEFQEFLAKATIQNDGGVVKGDQSPQLISYAWMITNQKILDRAYRDISRYVGLNCKEWVRVVVRDATGRNIPSTAPNAYGWYWAYSPYVASWCGMVEYASTGQILQMWWGGVNRPHTAIICGKSSTGMYWVDSNFCSTNYVCLHWVSYSYFYSKVGGNFSINQIL